MPSTGDTTAYLRRSRYRNSYSAVSATVSQTRVCGAGENTGAGYRYKSKPYPVVC